MKKYLSTGLLAIVLCYTMVLQGCSLAWIGTLDSIVAAAGPALNNVLTIISLAQNKPVPTALENKITADFANIKTLANDFAKASPSNAPTVCEELQAGITVINDDSTVVLSLVQASGSSNIAAIFEAASVFVSAITGLVPACASPAAINASKQMIKDKAVKMDAGAMAVHYNQVLTKPSGSALIDAYAKKHKIHEHNKVVRILTFGMEK